LLRTSRALRAIITAFLSLACFVAPVSAQPQVPSHMSPAEFWMSGTAVQGGLVIGRAPKGARSLFFNDAALELSPDGYFLIGFDRDAAEQARLVAMLADGSKIERNIAVAPGNWRIENVAANITGGAKSSAEFQARRSAELAQIAAARAVRSDSAGWRQTFIRPLSGRISGLFGAQRIYNGTPGSYHNGMDLAAPGGQDFVAPADGVVTLAANDAFTLEGQLLMIDHGMGLNSAFLHASDLLVKAGDHVLQGQVIGRVGATGRATGPHLHWGMKWNSARIDPKLLLPSG
jgi:murein DD-endopeptidase MepM/ murein hydrolase activator NlpD